MHTYQDSTLYDSISVFRPDPSFRTQGLNKKLMGGMDTVAYSKGGVSSSLRPKVNQDSILVHEGLIGDVRTQIFGVCDGHGPDGERVSNTVTGTFVGILERAISVRHRNGCRILRSTLFF